MLELLPWVWPTGSLSHRYWFPLLPLPPSRRWCDWGCRAGAPPCPGRSACVRTPHTPAPACWTLPAPHRHSRSTYNRLTSCKASISTLVTRVSKFPTCRTIIHTSIANCLPQGACTNLPHPTLVLLLSTKPASVCESMCMCFIDSSVLIPSYRNALLIACYKKHTLFHHTHHCFSCCYYPLSLPVSVYVCVCAL